MKGLIVLYLNVLNRTGAVVVDQESDFEFTSSKWQEKQDAKGVCYCHCHSYTSLK